MNEKAEKDWVTARALCSLPNVFKELRSQIEGDIKTRNALRPNNSPYEFSVTENGGEFAVVLEAKDTNRSVIFSLAGHAIRVRDSRGNEIFDVTLTFSDEGECRLNVQEKERELWQVRRMALEELLFQRY